MAGRTLSRVHWKVWNTWRWESSRRNYTLRRERQGADWITFSCRKTG